MSTGMEIQFPRNSHGNGSADMPKMGMGRIHVTMGFPRLLFTRDKILIGRLTLHGELGCTI